MHGGGVGHPHAETLSAWLVSPFVLASCLSGGEGFEIFDGQELDIIHRGLGRKVQEAGSKSGLMAHSFFGGRNGKANLLVRS